MPVTLKPEEPAQAERPLAALNTMAHAQLRSLQVRFEAQGFIQALEAWRDLRQGMDIAGKQPPALPAPFNDPESPQAAIPMVHRAATKGHDQVVARGSDRFQRYAWATGRMLDVAVANAKPGPDDLEFWNHVHKAMEVQPDLHPHGPARQVEEAPPRRLLDEYAPRLETTFSHQNYQTLQAELWADLRKIPGLPGSLNRHLSQTGDLPGLGKALREEGFFEAGNLAGQFAERREHILQGERAMALIAEHVSERLDADPHNGLVRLRQTCDQLIDRCGYHLAQSPWRLPDTMLVPLTDGDYRELAKLSARHGLRDFQKLFTKADRALMVQLQQRMNRGRDTNQTPGVAKSQPATVVPLRSPGKGLQL